MTNIGLQPSIRYNGESSFDFFNTEDLFTVLTPPLVGETISDDKENLILIEDGEKKEYVKKNIQPSSIPPLEEVRVSMEHSESIPRAWRREMISFSISLSESKEEEMDSDSCFGPIFVTYMLKLSLSGFELNSLIISMTSSFSFLLAFLLIELSSVVIK